MAKLILSFTCGMKVGKGDLRELSNVKLLEVGLVLKVLRMENNYRKMEHWRIVVNEEEKAIEGGIREAVRNGLVTEVNCEDSWGFCKMVNGVVYDWDGIYGEKGAVYGRMVDEVAMSVVEGLFSDSNQDDY